MKAFNNERQTSKLTHILSRKFGTNKVNAIRSFCRMNKLLYVMHRLIIVQLGLWKTIKRCKKKRFGWELKIPMASKYDKYDDGDSKKSGKGRKIPPSERILHSQSPLYVFFYLSKYAWTYSMLTCLHILIVFYVGENCRRW